MPRLRVLAGPSVDQLEEISANDGKAYSVASDVFEGRVAVFLKYEGDADVPSYFRSAQRGGVTWSIQVQGRFLQPRPADTVLFGNTFDRPLQLPWGTSAVLKFMHFVDPTLEQDLAAQQPWALSPFVCTMPYLKHDRLESGSTSSAWPQFPPSSPLAEDCESLGAPRDASKRRALFARRDVATTLGPDDLVTADFCYGFLSFPSLTLQLPGGLSFDCKKYWDGQPVRFVCCEPSFTSAASASVSGPGRVFWCVSFELEEDPEDEEEEAEVGKDDTADGGNEVRPAGNDVDEID